MISASRAELAEEQTPGANRTPNAIQAVFVMGPIIAPLHTRSQTRSFTPGPLSGRKRQPLKTACTLQPADWQPDHPLKQWHSEHVQKSSFVEQMILCNELSFLTPVAEEFEAIMHLFDGEAIDQTQKAAHLLAHSQILA